MGTPRIDRIDRNHIINGGLDFWQRVGSATTTVNTASAAGNYTSDRMLTYSDGPTVKNYSVLRSTSVPSVAQAGAALPFSRRFNCITAIASPAANDRVEANAYAMEGQDAQALYGQTVTFGFWVNTNVIGNHPFSVINSLPPAKSYVTSFNIASGDLNTQVFKTVTIPIESAGAIDNTRGLTFYIGGLFGSTYQASVGSWQTGVFQSFAGAANIMSSNTNFMSISGLQLIVGSTLPSGSFVRAGRTIAQELQLCQRYYEKSYDLSVNPASTGSPAAQGIVGVHWVSGNRPIANILFKVTKRSNPAITIYSQTTGGSGVLAGEQTGTDISAGISSVGQNGFGLFQGTLSGTNSIGAYGHYVADAEL